MRSVPAIFQEGRTVNVDRVSGSPKTARLPLTPLPPPLIQPGDGRLPVLLSVPHSGRDYPLWLSVDQVVAASMKDLGRDFGAGLYEAEVRYLNEHEFARTADDILWRRTKLGLHIDEAGRKALEERLAASTSG